MQEDVDIDDVMIKTNVAGLDLLPANIDLSAAEIQLVNEVAREQALGPRAAPGDPRLRLRPDRLPALPGPAHDQRADRRPLRARPARVRVLLAARRGPAAGHLDKVRERLNYDLELDGILATMYDPRTPHWRQVLGRLVEAFGDKVFETVIRRTVKFPDANVAAEPITTYATNHPGAEAYRQLAKELISRGGAP